MGVSILLSFGLIICRDAPFGMSPPFGWPLPKVIFGLTIGAFVIPVGAALLSWVLWDRARLTSKNIGRVENVFQAALRESEFDEVERILRKNQQSLEQLPVRAASVLFHPAMVAALVDSHSLVHLELLANMRFLKSLENPLGAVDVVVRELLRSDVSPLRSAIVSRYGGLEYLTYSQSERALMEKTFENPEWYVEANAHYPLVMRAIEVLQSGELDAVYNEVGGLYVATQGVSTRTHCPIYLATKTEVLAIKAAIEMRVKKDLYITDLLDIFRAVQERSKFNEPVWQSARSNPEYPTPYAYLLYEIAGDLRDLSTDAVEKATSKATPPQVERPGQIARALALTWSYCVWCIADSQRQVSRQFRNDVIEQYLLFILALGWGPSEAYVRPVEVNVEQLHVWRDLFLGELQRRFVSSDSIQRRALKDAIESLDKGKRYVSEGYTWLASKLFGSPDE
jgi:hypothetical protein